jgi:hypothetical protein
LCLNSATLQTSPHGSARREDYSVPCLAHKGTSALAGDIGITDRDGTSQLTDDGDCGAIFICESGDGWYMHHVLRTYGDGRKESFGVPRLIRHSWEGPTRRLLQKRVTSQALARATSSSPTTSCILKMLRLRRRVTFLNRTILLMVRLYLSNLLDRTCTGRLMPVPIGRTYFIPPGLLVL